MDKSLTNRWLSLVVTAIPLMIMGLIQVQPAYAQGPVVNTAVDENDGSCADGDCSLRDAIATANSGETITFAGDLTIYLDSELQISDTLTIDGESHAITLSGDSGNDGSRNVRVFYIQNSGVITLTSLNIVSGTVGPGFSCPNYCGGGIFNEGILTLSNSTVSDSMATGNGGGIYLTGGVVTLNSSSTVSHNQAENGGGICNMDGGMGTLNNSVISDNLAYNEGGGIFNRGTMTISDSTLSDNLGKLGYGVEGAGIYNSGLLTINHTIVTGNQTDYIGAGIYNYVGTVTVNYSTISGNGNDQTDTGGAIYNNHGGLATINNSTLTGNQAIGGTAINNADGSTLTLNNSTISGNKGVGAAIINFSPSVMTINNSTIANHQALYVGIPPEGGISNHGTLHLLNSIVANNGGGIKAECSNGDVLNLATIATNAYNLIKDGSCNEVDGGSPIGFLTGDPLLGPLADNGGPTWTHAVLTGSPVINQGDPAFDPNAFTPPMTTDQRGPGFDRIINSRIDIGAFEFDPNSGGSVNVFLPLIIKG